MHFGRYLKKCFAQVYFIVFFSKVQRHANLDAKSNSYIDLVVVFITLNLHFYIEKNVIKLQRYFTVL